MGPIWARIIERLPYTLLFCRFLKQFYCKTGYNWLKIVAVSKARHHTGLLISVLAGEIFIANRNFSLGWTNLQVSAGLQAEQGQARVRLLKPLEVLSETPVENQEHSRNRTRISRLPVQPTTSATASVRLPSDWIETKHKFYLINSSHPGSLFTSPLTRATG